MARTEANGGRPHSRGSAPGSTRLWVLVLVAAVSLASCASNAASRGSEPEREHNHVSGSNAAIHTDPLIAEAREDGPVSSQDPDSDRNVAFRQIGRGQFISADNRPGQQMRTSSDGVELAFENVPIQEVVSAVIGDLIGAEFAIDPAVSGHITLRSARPISRQDLPAALDRALRLAGASLVETSDGVYLVTPEARAERFARGPRLAGDGLPPGFGTVIAPLRYVSAREMGRLLRPFAQTPNAIQIDEARELVILSGNSAQLEVLLETVALFDVDWLEEMSFALYRVRAAAPEALIGELNQIFGGEDGPIGSQLEFLALDRLGAIVIVAKNPDRLEQAETWIARLDVRADRGRRVHVLPLVNADAESLAERLNELFEADALAGGTGPVTVQADTESNSLLVIAEAEAYDQIREVVSSLDRAPDQVMIEVRIVEVVLNDDLRYGVQWFLDTRDGGELIWTGNPGGGVAASFPGFAYTFSSDYVRAALNAISSITDVETVSTPQIMALDNRSSMIQVGDQVPVITQSAVSVTDPDAPIVNSVEFRDTGVVLRVTPRIGGEGAVILEIEQEVSNVAETTTSGIDSPTIQQRRFDTTVMVHDGQTVALGGLIRSSRSLRRSGVPGLQRVPGLGLLFGETGNTSRRTELVVFLTPHVIRSADDAAASTRDLRGKLETLRERGFGNG